MTNIELYKMIDRNIADGWIDDAISYAIKANDLEMSLVCEYGCINILKWIHKRVELYAFDAVMYLQTAIRNSQVETVKELLKMYQYTYSRLSVQIKKLGPSDGPVGMTEDTRIVLKNLLENELRKREV